MKQKLLFFFLFLFCLSTARAAVYYVDGAGGSNTNTGTGGWADAKQDIQAAINAAASGDEIWVKAGTYLPTLDPNGGTSQRDKTFYITTKDVKLYGGFAGTETALSQRNPVTNVTTLSGNLDAVGNNDAYHVLVTLNRTSACVVDGFTISGGRTASSGSFNVNSPAAIVYSDCGGGMYNRGSSPTVSGCIFSSNTAFDGGGGMYNIFGSNPTVSGCVFSANVVSYNNGGGMYNNNNSSPVVSSCTFSANTANRYGGGMYYSDNSGGSITNCILYGNTVPTSRQSIYKGGAITTLTVSYSLIENYIATSNYISGAGILTANPMFVNSASPAGADGLWRTADDGLRIGCASPARDAGTGTTPATDILGNARVGAMDMGAYENPGTGCPLYVDGAGGNNANTGTSWASAKKDVQAAINAAASGDEIWVKAGTYLPTMDANSNAAPTDPKDKSFYITTKDVKLYGGFAGTETLLSQRNPITNVTTLSGDLDGAGGTDDACHVLLTINRTSACVVDGFTITGGRAKVGSSLTVATPSATISHAYGGGMYNAGSSPTINNCVFSANAANFGAGLYNLDNSNPVVNACVFSVNDANTGAGMYNNNSSPGVSGCVFASNTAINSGAGMFNSTSNPTVSNCVFTANAANRGGGMYSSSGSSPTVSSCTFWANTAINFGGGIYASDDAGGTITNAILYGNGSGLGARQNIYKTGTIAALTVSYSLIGDYDAGATNNYTVSNILVADPLFVNSANPAGADGIWRTADDGLRIGCASPARDAGTGTVPATDIVGNARVGAMDMGSYEADASCPNVLYVDGIGGNNANTGTSWATAKKDIQAAINAAAAGDEIWVKAGTYLPTEDPFGNASPADPRDKTFYIIGKHVGLYGGFAGTETLRSQRNPGTNVTILSGDLDGAGDTADAYHVLLIVNSSSFFCDVNGFTISGGRANGSGSLSVGSPAANIRRNDGGGMYNHNSWISLDGCAFSANATSGFGGGMLNSNSAVYVRSCVFSSNTANYGGGIANRSGQSVIDGCTFSGNTATTRGGGLDLPSTAGGNITNCIFYGNTGGSANQENIYRGIASGLTVSYTLIGDYSASASQISGTGIFAADPLFMDAANPAGADGVFGTADDGLALQPCSPAINAGTGTTPATDISGNGRVGAMDLGAYEYQGSPGIPILASAPTTTDSRTIQQGGIVSLGGCGAAIAEVLSEGAAPVEGIISATMYVHPTAPSANQTKYARRHYDISTVLFPSTATARITLYFTQADFDDYNTAIQGSGLPPLPIDAADVANNKANLRITQEHGTSSTGLPNSYSGWAGTGPKKVLITPTVSWSPLLSLWKVQFPVTGFSGFFVTSAISTPLPLELLHFSAKRVGETTNQLDWATGEEEGSTTFTIERSGDARSFAAIGVVSGKGSGSAYRFEDKQPLTGDNYYRLQVKEAGKSSYSQTVLVKGIEITTQPVELSPNPATDRVVIRCNNAALEGSRASVWGARGRLMKTFVLEAETVWDVSEWTAGVYLLRLADGSTLRLVKQ